MKQFIVAVLAVVVLVGQTQDPAQAQGTITLKDDGTVIIDEKEIRSLVKNAYACGRAQGMYEVLMRDGHQDLAEKVRETMEATTTCSLIKELMNGEAKKP